MSSKKPTKPKKGTPKGTPAQIGTLAENSLHAALKNYLARPGDRFEVNCEGSVIDIMRGRPSDDDSESGVLLIEIQTKNFSALKRKLHKLLKEYRVHVVHPIAQDKYVCRITTDGEVVSRRISPKHGTVAHVFTELVYIPHLMDHPNFSIEVLLTHEDEIRINDGKGSWRRKGWSIADRRLLDVVHSQQFNSSTDLLTLLPGDLPQQFTTRDIAEGLGERMRLAGQIAYSLREMGAIEKVGERGKSYLYEIANEPDRPT